MERLYPVPVAQLKSKTRCQYNLYNCRCIGRYELEGKFYCASHYDAVWKWLNPVLGTCHDWEQRPGRNYPTCRLCLAIKFVDGIAQGPCKGHQSQIFCMEEASGACLR